jgi:hypothetical protein
MKAEDILDSFRYYTGAHNHSRYNEINQAYRNILKRTKWWVNRIRKEDLLSLQANTYQYKVDFSCFRGGAPTHIYVKAANKDIWTLIEEDKFQNFESSRPNTDGVATSVTNNDCPTKYFLTGDIDHNFYITPTPSQNMDIRFDGIKAIEELNRGVIPIIHKDYHEAIALLASSIFLKQKKGATQSDLVLSASLKQEAEQELESLIEDLHPNRLNDLSWNPSPLLY